MRTKKLVRVSSKGQIVLPKQLRDKYDIGEGDYLVIYELSDDVMMVGKSKSDIFDEIAEPIRREAERQGFTREELMDLIKTMRKEPRSNKSNAA